MSRRRTTTMVLATCLALPVLAACGSSSSSTTSRAQFHTQLGALCGQLNSAAQTASKDPAKFAALIDQYVPKFRALTPPPGVKAAYAQYVSLLRQLATALKTSNGGEIRQLVPRARTLTSQLGAPECGR